MFDMVQPENARISRYGLRLQSTEGRIRAHQGASESPACNPNPVNQQQRDQGISFHFGR